MTRASRIKQFLLLHWDITFFIGIVAINLIAYFDSFFHICRSDQIVYLANTASDPSWFSLAFRHYSYNRSLYSYASLDPLLFRPLFFFFLGTARYLFGYNFILWQITSFLLHILVLWQLFQLLLKISKNYWAGFLTLFFSLILHNIDMVIWHHIFNYMIFLACLLWCLGAAYDSLSSQKPSSSSILKITILMGLACFIYELGFICCILFFLFFLMLKRKAPCKERESKPFLLLIPAFIYIGAYIIDLLVRQNIMAINMGITRIDLWETVKNMTILIFWFTTAGIFPASLETLLIQRTVFPTNHAFNAFVLRDLSLLASWHSLLSLGLVISYGLLLIFSCSLTFFKKNALFFMLGLGLLGSQILVITIGRMNLIEPAVLANSSYYSSFYWVFFIIVFSSAIQFQGKSKKFFMIKNIFMIFLVLITIISFNRSKKASLQRRQQDLSTYKIFNRIETLIKNQSHEENFSFFVPNEDCPTFEWIFARDDSSKKDSCLFSLLYPNYFRRDNPKYVVASTYKEKLEHARLLVETYLEKNPMDLQSFLILQEIYEELGIDQNDQLKGPLPAAIP